MRAIQEIDLAIPVQAFRFEFTVVARSELSFIREFILRLLKVGEMTSDQVAKFLGLSEKEMRVAITQLTSLKEVKISNDGLLSLTAESLKYFEGESSRPKVRSFFERTHTFKFDLINFNHIPSSQKTATPLRAIKLIPDPLVSSESSSHARRAFLQAYLDVFEKESIRFDGINNLHDVELYKLSDIRKIKDQYVRMPIKFYLDVERNTIEHRFNHKLCDSPTIIEKVNEYFSVASESNNIQSVAKAMDLFYDRFSLDCLTPHGLDGTGYDIKLRSESSGKSRNVHFIGALTLSDNWEKLYKPIKSITTKAPAGKSNALEIIWVAPSDRHWIQSDIVLDRLGTLKELVKENQFRLMVPVDGADDHDSIHNWRSQLGELKKHSQKFCSGFLDGVVELIIIPEHLAVVVYHLQQPDEVITIPMGFITEDRSMIQEIQKNFETYLNGYSDSLESRQLGSL